MLFINIEGNLSNRVTPVSVPSNNVSTAVNTPRIRFAEVDDVMGMGIFQDEDIEEQENVNEMPRFGQPSVTASESQIKYGSTVSEIVNPYEIVPWAAQKRDGFENHCSVFIWLQSVLCVTTVTPVVSDCQRKLEVYTKLPSILDKNRLDERN